MPTGPAAAGGSADQEANRCSATSPDHDSSRAASAFASSYAPSSPVPTVSTVIPIRMSVMNR
jgi:hypothetical protein